MQESGQEGRRHDRRIILSGAPWEEVVGYARAVRVGQEVWVSGTTATDGKGGIVGEGDAEAQTRQAIRNLAEALREAGASLDHVVRTRLFVTDMRAWPAVARAHAEAFGSVRPASTMVEVVRLIDPGMLVEIEADARIPPTSGTHPQESSGERSRG